ncbi:retrovirus-related pol polyprotein from transposon TNT 1-94 [Tanacetum coccineum]
MWEKSRCLDLEADMSKVHDESKHISKLEGECLNLQLKYQHLQESFDNNKSHTVQEAPDFNSFFKIKNLEHQIQEKDNVIRHLKDLVANVNDRSCEPYNAKDVTALIEQNDCVRVELEKELLEYVIGTCPKSFNERDNKAPSTPVTRKKQVTFSDKPGTSSSNTQKHEVHQKVQQTNIPVIPSTGVNDSTEASGSKPRSNTKKNRILPAKKENKKEVEVHLRTNKSVWTKVNRVDSSISSKRVVINFEYLNLWQKLVTNVLSSTSHENVLVVITLKNSVNATSTVKIVLNKGKQIWKPKGRLSDNSLCKTKRVWKATGKLFTDIGYQWRPTGKKLALGKLDCGYQWRPTGKKFALGEMCHLTKLSVKCRTGHALVSGLRLFKTYDGKSFKAHEFCGKVHRYDLKSITTWKGLGYESILSSKPNHGCGTSGLNHLNFGMINDLARKDLVRGLPRLKFEKDHLCSACQLGKSKKFSHRPKSENTNMEVLHTLHMDLCGPMRVQSIKGKKYILVIVDDYSRFTWVKFLRSKDETPEFVTNFLKQIQVGLNKTVRFIRTDNGTEFVNQVMSEYYEGVGIFHQKSVPRTPQQNGVVERRNRTLVEAARTMMIFSKAPMFLWAEAVATACYTQNRSLIHTRHNKTPYELDTSLLQQIAQDAPSTSASSSTSDIAIIHQHQEIAEEPTHEDTPIHHDGTYPKLITTRSSQKMDQRSTSWITWWQSTLSFLYLPENVTIRCFDGAVSTILNCPKSNL